jgi:hypothetical protein
LPTKNALSCPFAFWQSAKIPAGAGHFLVVGVGGTVVVVVVVLVVVVDVVVVDVVVVDVVVVDVVVDEVTTVSVKLWVALPAPFAAFKSNLIVPGFSGEPTRTGTPLLVLI